VHFQDWHPQNQIFAEEGDSDSATLQAVRRAYQLLGEDNPGAHCGEQSIGNHSVSLYYLV
jgi:hypothetical protein